MRCIDCHLIILKETKRAWLDKAMAWRAVLPKGQRAAKGIPMNLKDRITSSPTITGWPSMRRQFHVIISGD